MAHRLKSLRCKIDARGKNRGFTDSWHYHENGGISVVIETKFGSAIVRVPARSLRLWATEDRRQRGEGE